MSNFISRATVVARLFCFVLIYEIPLKMIVRTQIIGGVSIAIATGNAPSALFQVSKRYIYREGKIYLSNRRPDVFKQHADWNCVFS